MVVPYVDLAESIFQPHLADKPILAPGDITKAMSKYDVNEPQAVAILSALRTSGFILIQGYAMFDGLAKHSIN
jgi:senataxin